MRHKRELALLGCLIAGTLCAPLVAQASDIVSMELTNAGPGNLGGVYTSPYEGVIGPAGITSQSGFTSSNSQLVAIYCDDFATHVSIGDIWQAVVTQLSTLQGQSTPDQTLKFDTAPGDATKQEDDYMAAALLAEQIAGINESSQQAELLSYALWGIFDNSALDALGSHTGYDYETADQYMQSALNTAGSDTPDEFSNVYIYTPYNPTQPNDGKGDSQEYLVIVPKTVPEPGTFALFAAGLMGLGVLLRRRRVLTAAVS
ncbi:MAG: PEP-CTERM sorting domain-containing protein [Steroidobacteraceae bacterium]